MMKILTRVSPYEYIPWWLGFVRHSTSDQTSLCAVVPLSFILRIGYLVWTWLRYPFINSLVEQREIALRKRVAWLDKFETGFRKWEAEGWSEELQRSCPHRADERMR
jgi:hypothetical protein